MISYKRKFELIGSFLRNFYQNDPKKYPKDVEILKKTPKTGKIRREIDKAISKLLSVWGKKAEEIIEELKMNMEDQPLLEYDDSEEKMKTNFQNELFEMIQYVKILGEMGFSDQIDSDIHSFVNDNKKI